MKKKPVRQRISAPLSTARKRAAFNDMADAIGRYLKTVGWSALLVASPRIQQQLGARAFNYEFVVQFTGAQKKGRA